MPRGPGSLYREVAMEAASAAFLAAGADAERVPSLKEVYLEGDGVEIAVKVSERRAPLPPSLLRKLARSLLHHAKERMKRPELILVVAGKLTIGALRLAQRLKWIRVLSLRTLGDRLAKLLRITIREIATRRRMAKKRSTTKSWVARAGAGAALEKSDSRSDASSVYRRLRRAGPPRSRQYTQP